ncbi:MAG: hypothetical protein IJ735_01665 [Clostridia bacterium]|nr:hypothetical protein [Clostridia bacterium]
MGEYVYLGSAAAQYLGHAFVKSTTTGWTTATLTDVDIVTTTTTAWSPVTYGHLCYYVNGLLTMPGGIEGLFNIFDVDVTSMRYDQTSFQEDISTYGLYTYEEFSALVPVTEEVFSAFNGRYLKVAVGKGLTSIADIYSLWSRYEAFLA